MSDRLAVDGGAPVRDVKARRWPRWPVWDEREEKALLDALRSGMWGQSTQVQAFQEEFARFQDAQYGVGNVNGTASLEAALRAAGIGMGDGLFRLADAPGFGVEIIEPELQRRMIPWGKA